MVYLVNLFIVPVYYLLIRIKSRSKQSATTLFFVVVSIHAILFRALASPYHYEIDAELYANAFRNIKDMSFFETIFTINFYTHWGQLYLALNWFLGQFSTDPAILFIVVAALTVGMTLWFYYKTSYSILTTTLLYLMYPMMYIMGFGVLRQHLSISVALIALLYWDRVKVFIILLICASFLHPSGLIIFPFLLFKRIKIQRFSFLTLVLYSFFFFYILRLLILLVLPYYSKYQAIYSEGEAKNNIVPVLLIGSMIIMYYVTGAIKKISHERDLYIFRFLVYGLIVSLFSMGVPGAGRLSLVFIYILPTTISHIIYYSDRRNIYLCRMYTAGVFFLTTVLIYISNNSVDSCYSSYSFFWNAANI